MRTPKHRFLASSYTIWRDTWPWGVIELVLSVIEPLVNRIVFLIILIRVFKDFIKHIDPSMGTEAIVYSAIPVVIAILIAVVLPTTIAMLRGFVHQRREKLLSNVVLKRYTYLVRGRTRRWQGWRKYFRYQKAIYEYYLFDIALALFFLFYNWVVCLTYIFCTSLFLIVGAKLEPINSIGTLNVSKRKHYAFLSNSFFGAYLLTIALYYITFPQDVAVELLIVMIIGARMQFGKGTRIMKARQSLKAVYA